jgi:hypothetical protein
MLARLRPHHRSFAFGKNYGGCSGLLRNPSPASMRNGKRGSDERGRANASVPPAAHTAITAASAGDAALSCYATLVDLGLTWQIPGELAVCLRILGRARTNRNGEAAGHPSPPKIRQ